ncbi:uncharacterized protein LOC124638524 [Helicoverpa zea]|uniref:uncharacterized protein LOC124636654 n=1 Tax=Helicoverpa zea TaxID=7113 RepID=UPI001F5901F5|nr:uncharacterized protein LOC124636654 [Helicoverpa zea]XP_047031455.1 uncharacterized protein LOC124638524 [Helicoverpa zea]
MMRSPDSKMSKSNPDLCTDNVPGTNVTLRSGKRKQPDCEADVTQAIALLSDKLTKNIGDLRVDMNNQFTTITANINNLREEFNTLSLISAQIQNDIKELRAEYLVIKKDMSQFDTKHKELSQIVTELKSTVNFNSDNYADCEKRLTVLERHVNNSAASTVELLERKIDSLEQQARQCNVEIGNMPEKRGENLITVLQSIGSALNMSLTSKDIISIHRVPHAHPQNNRPKNVIVKFTSKLMRDNVLSAYRLSKGLTSDRIGLTGAPCRIYMNEHLTLRNKELFRKCREAAKSNKFKFVWVRNATVLVKESEDSSTYAIRSEEDISKKIKPNPIPTTTAAEQTR